MKKPANNTVETLEEFWLVVPTDERQADISESCGVWTKHAEALDAAVECVQDGPHTVFHCKRVLKLTTG